MLSESDPERDVDVPRASSIQELRWRPPEGAATADHDVDARLALLKLCLHDLQAPVAILDISMRLLATDLAAADPEVRETLEGALRAARRIQQYIDHFVVSERIHGGVFEARRGRFDVGAQLEGLAAEYRAHAELGGVTLEVDLVGIRGLNLLGDETLICRVLQNLLENAVRHASPGGRVRLFASDSGKGRIEVRVQNDGPPLPLKAKARLFDPLAATSGGPRAVGLGLHFCKLAVEAHHGRMAVVDDPSWPVSFVMDLPLTPP